MRTRDFVFWSPRLSGSSCENESGLFVNWKQSVITSLRFELKKVSRNAR